MTEIILLKDTAIFPRSVLIEKAVEACPVDEPFVIVSFNADGALYFASTHGPVVSHRLLGAARDFVVMGGEDDEDEDDDEDQAGIEGD